MTRQPKSSGAELLDLALADPSSALVQCNDALDSLEAPADRATVLRARGLALRVLGDLDSSSADLEAGLEVAQATGDLMLVCGVTLTLAGTRVFQGRTIEAKDLLHTCITQSTGELRAEAIFQLGTTHAQSGDLDEALAHYAKALPLLRRHKRKDWESNLLGNRGVMHFFRGDYDASIRDLDRAIDIQRELDIPAQAAINMLNKAQALYMSGDIASSLHIYRDAEDLQDELRMPVLMHAQKCETYLAAGLFEACLELAQQSHRFHRQGQLTIGQIRALLPGAEAALALEQNDLAIDLAQAVHDVPGAENFPIWLARADLIRLEALALQGTASVEDIEIALRIQHDAERGDSGTSAQARLVAAQIALQLGMTGRALELLSDAANRARRTPLHTQIHRWGLLAEARSSAANSQGSLSAVRTGLRSFDRLLTGVTSFDVRVRASRHAQALTEVGVREHLKRGRLEHAVALIERLRSGALEAPQLSRERTQELIAAETRVRRAEQTDAAELLRLQGLVPAGRSKGIGTRQLGDDESLLTWVEADGEMLCIARTAVRTTIHPCGSVAEIATLVNNHHFLCRQMARRSRLSAHAAKDLLDRKRLADRLLGEKLVVADLRGRVILNPSATLVGVAWGALPGLENRPHVLSPSIRVASRRLPKGRRVASVLGSSELPHVKSELAGVARSYALAPILDPGGQTVKLIDGVDIAHIAGHFISDGSDPLLSGVPLGEFMLRGSDYLRLKKPPAVAVLSACASGATDIIGGAGIGFATAALSAGTACVIATQTLIEDSSEIVATMSSLHKLLAAGEQPADALRLLRSQANGSEIAAHSLITIGTGWNRS